MTNFINIYFKDSVDGKLNRSQYLGYFFIASLVMIVLGIGMGAILGVAEHLVGGNLQEAQALLQERFSILLVVAVFLFAAAFGFAYMNITAKRIRDIGLPAWPMIVLIVVLSGIASQFANEDQQYGVSTVVLLALLIIPGRTIGRVKDERP